MDHKCRGSMMVEACLFLPIFLVLLMAMAGAFRFLQLEESLLFSGLTQMQQCSAEMSLNYPVAKVSRLYLEHQIIQNTLDDMGKHQRRWIDLVGVTDKGMFFSQEEWEHYEEVQCRIHCSWSLGNNRKFGGFSDELRFTGRVWKGENSISVWIFPTWGECYHTEDCYISGGTRLRTVRSIALEQGYRPCQHCLKGD